MPNGMLDRLQSERSHLVEFVDETLTRANDEGRDLVDAEQRNLATSQERIAQLDAQIKPLADFENVRAAAVEIDRRISGPSIRTAPRPSAPAEFRGFGDLYVDSPEFQSRGIQARAQLNDVQGYSLAMQTRAVLTTLVDPGKSFLPQPQQYTPQQAAFATPLLDAVTRVPVTTGSVEILTWGEPTGFDIVPEGGDKPELQIVNGSENVPLEQVAGWIQYTRQLAADSVAFRTLLNSGLTRGLLRKLEALLGTAISQATLPEVTGAAGQPLVEVVRLAIATIQSAGFVASHVMASPENLAQLDLNVLNLGGAAATVLGNGLWSLTPVPVPGLNETIVSDASAAFVLFERTGIEIFTTDSDIVGSGATAKSAFRANILTTLAETRAKGAVLDPNAACVAHIVAGTATRSGSDKK
jgi:HK97 family phage major capsid protein